MNFKIILPFLIILTLWINYTNYYALDKNKIISKISLLEDRIVRENHITDIYRNKTLLKELKQSYNYYDMMFPKKLSYSKTMGQVQQMLNSSIDKHCKINDIKWGKSAPTKLWYEKLRMNVKMHCTPNGFVTFNDNLNTHKKIHAFENFKIFRLDKTKNLMVSFQFIAYKLKETHEH